MTYYIPRCAEALMRARAELNEPRDLRVVKALALAAIEASRRATSATPDVHDQPQSEATPRGDQE